jgi:poly(3-hydroxybutyrate) depolymerase
MKLRNLFAAALLLACASASGQGDSPAGNVVYSQEASWMYIYGTPVKAEGRSYNFAPSFFVYPDGKLDARAAEALVADMDVQKVLDENFARIVVLAPVGEKYDEAADYAAFEALYNRTASGNLKIIGLGAGATFVNQVIAVRAGDQVAGILTVGGKPAKLPKGFASGGVPAYVAGKGAAKAAAPYIAMDKAVVQGDRYVNPGEELLQVVVDPAERPLAEVFADAWAKVFSRNYRYNNYKHTYYEETALNKYGPYELEPYFTEWSELGIERIIVEQPTGYGPRAAEGPKYLWYEYWPAALLKDAPAQSVPMVVLLHGNRNDPRTQAETSGFIQLASKEGFMAVEMEWQGNGDYTAMGLDGIETVIYQLLDKYPQLDPSRIYAEGLSAGSMTATSLGIRKSHVFAAVGGHSGGGGSTSYWNEATQKRGAVEMPYCSVFGTLDTVVPYIKPDRWRGNGYLSAWNTYEQMNGMEVVSEMDFSIDPVFGQAVRDRQTIRTNKGPGITIETGQLYKGDVPLIRLVAVIDYCHWNFVPTAQVMWDFFKMYRRDPETRKLVYLGR